MPFFGTCRRSGARCETDDSRAFNARFGHVVSEEMRVDKGVVLAAVPPAKPLEVVLGRAPSTIGLCWAHERPQMLRHGDECNAYCATFCHV